jgi:uncharacterized membrane protein
LKQKLSTKRIAMAGLMAALTAVGSGIRVVIPVSIGGNTAFHLGNIFCALSGILLGPWLGGAAAGLGSFLFDMSNPMYAAEAWLTFLMKGAYGLSAGLVIRAFRKDWGYWKAILATASGAFIYAIVYLGKNYLETMIVQGVVAAGAWVAVTTRLPATIFNAAVAMIFAPILAVAIRKALERNHISLD